MKEGGSYLQGRERSAASTPQQATSAAAVRKQAYKHLPFPKPNCVATQNPPLPSGYKLPKMVSLPYTVCVCWVCGCVRRDATRQCPCGVTGTKRVGPGAESAWVSSSQKRPNLTPDTNARRTHARIHACTHARTHVLYAYWQCRNNGMG